MAQENASCNLRPLVSILYVPLCAYSTEDVSLLQVLATEYSSNCKDFCFFALKKPCCWSRRWLVCNHHITLMTQNLNKQTCAKRRYYIMNSSVQYVFSTIITKSHSQNIEDRSLPAVLEGTHVFYKRLWKYIMIFIIYSNINSYAEMKSRYFFLQTTNTGLNLCGTIQWTLKVSRCILMQLPYYS